MPNATTAPDRLAGTEGYKVETSTGTIGFVEEVWLGQDDQPAALAVRTSEGTRALLLADQVDAVERGYRWVVVEPDVSLLELDAPRLSLGPRYESERAQIVASWATTGVPLPTPPARVDSFLARLRRKTPGSPKRSRPRQTERPLWQMVAILYGLLAAVLTVMLALTFLIPLLAEGSAY